MAELDGAEYIGSVVEEGSPFEVAGQQPAASGSAASPFEGRGACFGDSVLAGTDVGAELKILNSTMAAMLAELQSTERRARDDASSEGILSAAQSISNVAEQMRTQTSSLRSAAASIQSAADKIESAALHIQSLGPRIEHSGRPSEVGSVAPSNLSVKGEAERCSESTGYGSFTGPADDKDLREDDRISNRRAHSRATDALRSLKDSTSGYAAF